jgi:methyl-accepting chemotaxis protein
VNNAIAAWTVGQSELKRLLDERIDNLTGKLHRSLWLAGALAALSILLALLTHRHIVRPLARLEGVARTVRETKDYRNRIDYKSEDEIGRLAVAFNEMLAERTSGKLPIRKERVCSVLPTFRPRPTPICPVCSTPRRQ